MKSLFSVFVGLVCAYLIAFSPSCTQVPAITADAVQIVDCVEAQLEAGNDTFEAIALACAPAAIGDVVTIVTAEATKDASPHAAAAAKVHHAGVAR